MSEAASRDADAQVRLRGHHFVCLQFYRGEGYSATFVENLYRIIEQAAEMPALVVGGADDVCGACQGLARDGSCMDPSAGEVEVRRIDRLAFAILAVAPGDAISLSETRSRLRADAVATGRWRAEACAGCVWEDVCEPGWDELLGG